MYSERQPSRRTFSTASSGQNHPYPISSTYTEHLRLSNGMEIAGPSYTASFTASSIAQPGSLEAYHTQAIEQLIDASSVERDESVATIHPSPDKRDFVDDCTPSCHEHSCINQKRAQHYELRTFAQLTAEAASGIGLSLSTSTAFSSSGASKNADATMERKRMVREQRLLAAEQVRVEYGPTSHERYLRKKSDTNFEKQTFVAQRVLRATPDPIS